MGVPNKSEMKGKFKQAKGAIKEKVGRATGDAEMEDEGAAERVGGRVQEGAGKARRKVGEAIKKAGKAVGR